MIEVKNLTKKYGTKTVLDDISFSFGPGEIIGLFGANGVGKTTLMKSILQLIKYSGSITLDGEKISYKNIAHLSFATCEHSFFPMLTAQEHKDFYKDYFPTFKEKRFDGLMEFFSIPKNKKIGNLSQGQQNQVEVILALSQGADYILMDEPFVGNDIFNREDFYKVLMGILEPNETILLSTHLIEEVSNFVGRTLVLNNGKIVADVDAATLEEENITLLDYIKKTLSYESDRVVKALSQITGDEE